MSSAAATILPSPTDDAPLRRSTRGWRSGVLGAIVLLCIALPCLLTLPWSLQNYDIQRLTGPDAAPLQAPSLSYPMGTDLLGRSLLWRCLLGGAISLGIGLGAAGIAVAIGVSWGAIAGYAGGRIDALMMRIVDVLYGLPYILLVVLMDLALSPVIERLVAQLPGVSPARAMTVSDIATLFLAIGGVSWLTMARVIRGQVLSLRSQPFIEAARACGLSPVRILVVHLLPNLIGPIVVYTTLTVPAAILQESFLSFLGIGVQAPMPSWGNLASEGLAELHALSDPSAASRVRWWLPLWPCLLLGLTLLSLNFLGDALRNKLDPRSPKY